jgi:pyruvate/2-oxoglutarate dehydrogenase complex dihydrolipoamide dehydrogenase (E3) component
MTGASADRFDAIVVGTGQAGVPLAVALAQAGRRTAIIERRNVGGTCVNEGCTPTKTMVASARTAYVARRAADYGVRTGFVSVDLAAVVARKRTVVESFRHGGEKRLAKAGVELIRGNACYLDARTIRVATVGDAARTVTSPLSVINTGGHPARPDIPGLDEVTAFDSMSIMELTALPDHLVVIGGGYVAVEFAQMFRRFGSAVTIIQRGPRLLGREDPDVADGLAEVLRGEGVEVLLGAMPTRVEPGRETAVAVTAMTAEGERTVSGSHLLVATGREPNTATLGLDAAGVEKHARGYVKVNERLQTTAPGIYAAGDVTGAPEFTHVSYDDYRILRRNLLENGHATTTGRLVPYTVFTDPQLGRIGMTESEARGMGLNVRVARLPMSAVARAIETDETRGFMKVVVDANTQRILGAAILGLEGGEIMGAIEIAMLGELPYPRLRDAIFAHPTLMEALNTLFGTL